jgi:hypothetical protein
MSGEATWSWSGGFEFGTDRLVESSWGLAGAAIYRIEMLD